MAVVSYACDEERYLFVRSVKWVELFQVCGHKLITQFKSLNNH